MWMRFETVSRQPGKRWGWGALQCMYDVLSDEELSHKNRTRLDELRVWFNKNLPGPPRKRIHREAIFWFKCKPDLGKPQKISPWKRRPLTKLAARSLKIDPPSDVPIDKPIADEVMHKVHELMSALDDMGYDLHLTTTNRPGYVVYEDPYQIAAIPFKDTIDPNLLD